MADGWIQGAFGQRVTCRSSEEAAAERRRGMEWQPGAMRAEERDRLIRIGLALVVGDAASRVDVRREVDLLWVGQAGDHLFGLPPDPALGDDVRTVFEHDVERLVDELCETQAFWAKRLPECPRHPDSHALVLRFTDSTATATCPVDGTVVRAVAYR